jgi:hypothetical protein
MRKVTRWARWLALLVVALLIGPASTVATGMVDLERTWWRGSRESAGLSPDPVTHPQALVQVFGARAVRWRGAFAIHTWVAVKRVGAETYTRYEVIGWRYYRGLPPLSVTTDVHPDRHWFGNRPEVLAELRGEAAEAAIAGIEKAVAEYPLADRYRTWPGPNSNTFTAHVGRQVPELKLDLPPTAIGKDYLPGAPVARPPSGTGIQVSFFGLLGAIVSPGEGLEINVLGLSFGIDVHEPALRLPGLGRVPLART